MVAAAFIGFLALVVAAVIVVVDRYRHRRASALLSIGLTAWFVYVGLMVYLGVVRSVTIRPPGTAFIGVPVAAFLVLFAVRAVARRSATEFPLRLTLGAQCFRVGVELFLHQLWILGVVPRMLTFAGANVDVYIGASAPVVAWLSTRGRTGVRAALVWNGLGLAALANVVVRAILTAPGPLHRMHAEVPNLMFATLPYTFIPAFFVPMAVVLHVLAIRSAVAVLQSPP